MIVNNSWYEIPERHQKYTVIDMLEEQIDTLECELDLYREQLKETSGIINKFRMLQQIKAKEAELSQLYYRAKTIIAKKIKH